MKAFNQMMELEYQTRYRRILTVGEALRLLRNIDEIKSTMTNLIKRFLESDIAVIIGGAIVGALIALGLLWAYLSTM